MTYEEKRFLLPPGSGGWEVFEDGARERELGAAFKHERKWRNKEAYTDTKRGGTSGIAHHYL